MKSLIYILLLLSSSSFATPRKVYPLKAEVLSQGAYNFDLNANYSQTLSFYDVEGTEVELEESQAYTMTDTDIKLSYGYSRKLELSFGGKYRQITSEDSVESTTTSGIENINIGFKYALKKKSNYRYAISGAYIYKLYENTIYTNSSQIPEGELVLGDSGQEFNLKFHLSYIHSKWTTMEAMGGYTTPANETSPELPYNFRYIKNFNSWAIWAGIRGVYTLGTDEYKDSPASKPINANGSTNRWNSINRSFMQPYAGLRVLFAKKYRTSIEVAQTMSGTSTDKAMDASLNISWTTGGKSNEEIFEESFKEYTTEATVIKVFPRGKFLKIDKGLAQDVGKGSKVDIYKSDYFGGNILIATGVVYESGSSWAIVKLVKKYRSVPIEKGLTARVK